MRKWKGKKKQKLSQVKSDTYNSENISPHPLLFSQLLQNTTSIAQDREGNTILIMYPRKSDAVLLIGRFLSVSVPP